MTPISMAVYVWKCSVQLGLHEVGHWASALQQQELKSFDLQLFDGADYSAILKLTQTNDYFHWELIYQLFFQWTAQSVMFKMN